MGVIAWVSGGVLALHVFVSWLFVLKLEIGIVGTTLTIGFAWWVSVVALFAYTVCGGCPETWTGFSVQAFLGLWDFFKLAVASGVMLLYVFSLSVCRAYVFIMDRSSLCTFNVSG